jgi:phospholipid/cholesterol/gamma-HCH transport system ATP-binding protein
VGAGGRTPVLEIDDVWLPLPDQQEAGVAADFTLHAGDLVLVQPGDEQHERLLVDLACGLRFPVRGAVRFLGRPWSDARPDQANALRGRIGHVLHRGAWVPYHTLLDNLLLPQLYHTRRPYAEVRAEAARWAERFGLAGLPTARPPEIPSALLRRAACIRAFLGEPSLIVVESLPGGLGDGLLAPLINAMRVIRDHDGAVLWFIQDADLYEDRSLPATARLRLLGDVLVPLEGVG